MTRPSHADDPKAAELRQAVAAELIALRQVFGRRTGTATMSDGDLTGRLGKVLRANPAWAAGAAAGAVAGVVAAVRRRLGRGAAAGR